MRELLIAGLILVVGGVIAYIILRPRPDPRVEALAKSVGLSGPVTDIRFGGLDPQVETGETEGRTAVGTVSTDVETGETVTTVDVIESSDRATGPAPAPVTTTVGTLRGTTSAPLTAPLFKSIDSRIGF